MEYSADLMAERLAAIPLEGKNVEEVAEAAKAACLEFGVELRRFDSRKSSKEPGARMMYWTRVQAWHEESAEGVQGGRRR